MKTCLFLCIFSPLLLQASSPIEKLTLDQAIHKGIHDRSSLRSIEAEKTALTYKGRSFMSKWLPQHHIRTGIDHASGKTGLCSGTPSFFELSTTQLLASGSNPYDNYAITEGQKDTVDAQYLAKKDSIQFEIEKSFLHVWLINEQRKRINSLALSTQATFAQRKAEFQQNLIDQPDWQSKEAEFIAGITEVKNFDEAYENAQAQLSYSMGLYDYKEFNPVWTPQKIPTLEQLSWYVSKALEHRKEIKIIDSQIQTKNIEISKTLRGYLPSVSAFASVYLQEGHPDAPTATKNGGLQLSWSIGDGISQYFDAENLRALQLQLKESRISLVKQIKHEVTTSYYDVVTRMRTLASNGFKLRAAHATWKKKSQEKDLGIITKSELEQAFDSLQQERFLWISSRINYEIAYRTLAYACGYGF